MNQSYNTILFKLITFYLLLLIASITTVSGQTVFKGVVKDADTKETLPGVAVQIKNTTKGAVTDNNGNYLLETVPGKYDLVISYLAYQTVEFNNIEIRRGETKLLNFELKEATVGLNEVVVVARKNMEDERILTLERQNSAVALENIGAKEMSVKGLSTVADGVKKITGISMEGNSKVIVRGLGDRYSMTSLNGFPIASPNPDNKLIPLTLFPTTIVKNVSVSKVYQPSVFGDYSGAHINVETKENIGADFFTVGVSTGTRSNTTFADFYKSDKANQGAPYFGFNKDLKLKKSIKNSTSEEFIAESRAHAPFKTNFDINKSKAMPELGIEVGAGKSWKIGQQKLNALMAVDFNNSYVVQDNSYTSQMNAQGVIRDEFNYDKYLYETTLTALGQVSYSLRTNDMLSFNIMYVNNTEDIYMRREGTDAEGNNLIGSNSIYHAYTLLNNQLTGKHQFFNRLFTDWQVSYGRTTSDEPDRRQVMFAKNTDGSLSLFKLNQQETMRYFSELFEDEWNGELKAKYLLNKADNPNFIRLGLSVRDKSRDFYSANFYYNLRNITPAIDDIYNTSSYLNQQNLSDGLITIQKNSQPRNSYYAGAKIAATFVDFEYYPIKELLISGGVRYENASQWVRYWTDGAQEQKRKLNANDLFPALNFKYTLENQHIFRLSASRTITRPSFLEMAPFEYQESYGGMTSRGYADIKNGYNTNLDLRYEYFNRVGDMVALGTYYKYLQDPIERIQEYAGSAIQSYRNANKGTVAGVEFELKKKLLKDFKVDFNAAYMFTRISLPEGGTYTDSSRALQGASPYLINVDLNYAPKISKDRLASLSIVYNLQGPRIASVGIGGVNNVVESPFHTLDFIAIYHLNKKMRVKFNTKNILNQERKYRQKLADTNQKQTIEYYKNGISMGIGFTMDF